MIKKVFAGVLGSYIAIVFWITVLGREMIHTSSIMFHPFHSFKNIWMGMIRYGIHSNILGNIILFLPIGLMCPSVLRKASIAKSLILGLSLSMLIEVFQLILHRGYFEIDDLICNTFGMLIGYILYKLILKIIKVMGKC